MGAVLYSNPPPPQPEPELDEVVFIGNDMIELGVTLFALSVENHQRLRARKRELRQKIKYNKNKNKHKDKYKPVLEAIMDAYKRGAGFKPIDPDEDYFEDINLTSVFKLNMANTKNQTVREKTYALFPYLDNVATIIYSYTTYDDLVKFTDAIHGAPILENNISTLIINVNPRVHYEVDRDWTKEEELLGCLLYMCRNLKTFSLNGHKLETNKIPNALYAIYQDRQNPPELEVLELTGCYLEDGFFRLFVKVMNQITVQDQSSKYAISFGNIPTVNYYEEDNELTETYDKDVRWTLETIERNSCLLPYKPTFHYDGDSQNFAYSNI